MNSKVLENVRSFVKELHEKLVEERTKLDIAWVSLVYSLEKLKDLKDEIELNILINCAVNSAEAIVEHAKKILDMVKELEHKVK